MTVVGCSHPRHQLTLFPTLLIRLHPEEYAIILSPMLLICILFMDKKIKMRTSSHEEMKK
jgi:hypothetical protein